MYCLNHIDDGVRLALSVIQHSAQKLDMKRKGKLPGNAVVATVMSNLGLHLFAKEHGMDLECTSVGDRNVLERVLEKGYAIGGEQSGHMIFLEHATTGDLRRRV